MLAQRRDNLSFYVGMRCLESPAMGVGLSQSGAMQSQVDRTHRLTDRQTDREAERQTDRQTNNITVSAE